jgi:alanine-glyoxylate transaminase/serine-glyoxylate transaminase/serine-pyruvate transaminase
MGVSDQHFLQIPGPSPVPERIQRAMARQVIDHRGPAFGELGLEVLAGCREVFGTEAAAMIYPSSGSGGWEAAIVNLLTPGDRVLMFETGYFAVKWRRMAIDLGLKADLIPGDWRHPIDANALEARLRQDKDQAIKAVLAVHNETSTGVTSNIAEVRAAIDAAGHPALLLVDAISSLGSTEYRHDEWGADVTVSCSQKGLMLPPGLGLSAVSERALEASRKGGARRSYWSWEEMIRYNADGFFPFTPATTLLYGLREAIAMMREEGFDAVFARHRRLAAAARAAVAAWDLEIQCLDPAAHSAALTAVRLPDGHDADGYRRLVLDRFNMSLGSGLGELKGRVFRIGHLGACNALVLMGALCGVEMGFAAAGIPHRAGGVAAAMQVLAKGD